jgi:hypothetical protein
MSSFVGPNIWCRMQLEYIFLAKFADITDDGLFTVVGGGINKIYADAFPSSWGSLYLVARVHLTVEDAQSQHRIALERESPKGQIEPILGESSTKELPGTPEVGPDDKVGLTFALWLMNLTFAGPGVYKYRFKIDGRELGVAELLIVGPHKENKRDESSAGERAGPERRGKDS